MATFLLFQKRRLFLNDSTHRAYVSASAAFGANAWIDFVDVALRNSSEWAFIDAGTASGTIFSDFVSHSICF